MTSDVRTCRRGLYASSTRKATTDAIIPSTQAANLNNGDHDVMNEIIINGHNEDDDVKLTLA